MLTLWKVASAEAAPVEEENPVPAEPEVPVEETPTDPPVVAAEDPVPAPDEPVPEEAPVEEHVAKEEPVPEEKPAEEPALVAEDTPTDPPAAEEPIAKETIAKEPSVIPTDPPAPVTPEPKPEPEEEVKEVENIKTKAPVADEDIIAESPVLKATDKPIEDKNKSVTSTTTVTAAPESPKPTTKEPIVKKVQESIANASDEEKNEFKERKAPEQIYGIESYIPLMLFVGLFIVGLIVPYGRKKCASRKRNADNQIEREPLNTV